jgi:hypothetical protein
MHKTSNSLYDFTNVPSYLRSTSDLDLVPGLQIPTLFSSTSQPHNVNHNNNSLESITYRGLRDSGASVLTMPSFELNNSFNANQDYWPLSKDSTNNIISSNNKKNELSLSQTFQTFTIQPQQPTITLKAEPVYIERYTSFYSTVSINELIESIRNSLTIHSIDFTLNNEKAKFQCVFYDCFNNAVQFIIKIYQSKSGGDNNKLIEFQRRYGCCVSYNRCYQIIYQSLNLSSKLPYVQQFNNIPCEPNSLLKINPSLPNPKPILDNNSLNTLINMMKSNDIIASREGARCISSSNIEKTISNNKLLVDELINIILNIYNRTIHDDELERLVSEILLLVVNNQDCREIIINKLFNQLLLSLDTPITKTSNLTSSTGILQSRQTKRCLAQILAKLTETHSLLISNLCNNNLEYINILKKFEFVIDSQVSNFIKQTIQSINKQSNNNNTTA